MVRRNFTYRAVQKSGTISWDGKPARGKGGTADIFLYASRKGVPLIHINPLNQSVTYNPKAFDSP